MSSFLSNVLQYTKPDYWDETDYANVRFKKFTLSQYTEEYRKIKNEFIGEFGSNYNVTEISRIQHPYAYASCQIRRKQLGIINSSSTPNETRIYFRVQNVNQLDAFIEYNCDNRKASCTNYGSVSSTGCVVMAKQIDGVSYTSRSSNRYPDYIIKCKNLEGSNNDLQSILARLRL